MKINLHCHTNYSDGADIFKMAKEHKAQGFSAFVTTDHVYPAMLSSFKEKADARSLTSYDEFKKQAEELQKISKELDFPCMQGIELALYGEEVLVFGQQVCKDIFDYMAKIDLKEQEKYIKTTAYKRKLNLNLIKILEKNKEDSAYILCHPRLDTTPRWVLKPLYPLLDGFEFQNNGTYYFSDDTNFGCPRRIRRKIPRELRGKNKFYNSDAHSPMSVSRSEGNYHTQKIENLDDLIHYIKTPHIRSFVSEKFISNGR